MSQNDEEFSEHIPATLVECFLDFALLHWSEFQVVRMIDAAVRREAPPLTKDQFLNLKGVRNDYRNALSIETGVIDNHDLLVSVLTRMGIPIPVNLVLSPWDRWVPGDQVIIVVGSRAVSLPEVSGAMPQLVVGGSDTRSMMELTRFFQTKLPIEAPVQLELLEGTLASEEAQQRYQSLKQRPGTGAIILLGSSLVNPLVECLAEEVLPPPDDLSVKFRFGCPSPDDSVLNDPEPCEPEEEGIWLEGTKQLFPRMRDDLVIQALNSQANTQQTTRFPDAGLLLFDATRSPFLIGCIGHGGSGTYACCEALQNQVELLHRLAVWDDRLCEIVTVDRTAPKNQPVQSMDDLIAGEPQFMEL